MAWEVTEPPAEGTAKICPQILPKKAFSKVRKTSKVHNACLSAAFMRLWITWMLIMGSPFEFALATALLTAPVLPVLSAFASCTKKGHFMYADLKVILIAVYTAGGSLSSMSLMLRNRQRTIWSPFWHLLALANNRAAWAVSVGTVIHVAILGNGISVESYIRTTG